MRERLLNFLVCPITGSPLRLLIWEERPNKISEHNKIKLEALGLSINLFEKEITSGALINDSENIFYPIYKGIPRMLTYSCGVFEDFKKEFHKKIKMELDGFNLPDLQAPIGEKSVIKSFSKEWLDYDWNPEKYWRINSEEMYRTIRFMLDLENKSVENKSVLEVGIGIGGIANSVCENDGCELVGIDLSYAVDGAYKNFGSNIFFHIVQASAFNLPFKENSFYYVYSHGVLHHSSDPKTCFQNVSKLVKASGFLYVWLYSDTSENRNLLRRLLMVLEKMLRPIIWRLPQTIQNLALFPLSLLYLIHQNLYQRLRAKNMVNFSFREAYHAARDRFTPRYAYRFSEDELAEWFTLAGYNNLLLSSKRTPSNLIIHEFCLATSIIGEKKS